MTLDHEAFRALLAGEPLPALVIDLDAFDANVARHVAIVRAHGLTLRPATKSIRVPALVRRVLDRGGDAVRGLLCYAVAEAEALARLGFDDLIVAYPPWQASDLDRVVRLTREGVRVSVACDAPDALLRLSAAGAAAGVRVAVTLCVDMSLRLLGGRVHLGVRRSPLRDEDDVLALARAAAALPGVRLAGVLAYEAQVAGLGDDNPGEPAQNAAKRWLKRASARELGARRSRIAQRLAREGFALDHVNGGGTGSLDTTTRDTGVTEVSAGSGFFKPALFDRFAGAHVRALEPACFFALEVTRVPAEGLVTCLGGGYVASGAPGADKLPLPWLPPGLALLAAEGAGEVQTPLRAPPGAALGRGSPVVFRHAKAGEVCERFREALLVSGGRIVDRAPTYRGLGHCFF